MNNGAASPAAAFRAVRASKYNRPVRAAIPQDCDFAILDIEADKTDAPALLIPLTAEVRDKLYDRLVTAFAGVPQRYDMAAAALAIVGIEVPPAKRKAS